MLCSLEASGSFSLYSVGEGKGPLLQGAVSIDIIWNSFVRKLSLLPIYYSIICQYGLVCISFVFWVTLWYYIGFLLKVPLLGHWAGSSFRLAPVSLWLAPVLPHTHLSFACKFGFLPHLRTEIALRSFTLQWSLGCQAKVSFSVLCLPDLSVTTLLISFLQIPFHFLKVYYGIFKHKQSQRKEHKGPPGIRLPAPRIFNILLILFHAPPLPCSATGLLYRKPNQ